MQGRSVNPNFAIFIFFRQMGKLHMEGMEDDGKRVCKAGKADAAPFTDGEGLLQRILDRRADLRYCAAGDEWLHRVGAGEDGCKHRNIHDDDRPFGAFDGLEPL